jgi:hypothetical protein
MANSEEIKQNAPYVDLPNVNETFADSLVHMIFDGQNLRLDLGVMRWEPGKPPAPPTGMRYTAARLVMTPALVIETYNQLGKVVEMLVQRGMAQKAANAPAAKPQAKQ